MKICENPFAVLGACVRDDRRELAERADEAALLGGGAVDDSLTMLMQMNRRMTAELAWFPGSSQESVEAFVSYAKAASENRPEKLPSLEGIGSPLAQANALAAFFETWPETHSEYFIGMCRSMDRILSQVTVSDTLDVINRDREAGGWETISDELTLSGPLEDRLRMLCQTIRERAEKVEKEELRDILDRLFAYSDFDVSGSVGKTLSDAYLMCIHDREEELSSSILNQQKTLRENQSPASWALDQIRDDMEKWCKMTLPLSEVPGPLFRKATTLCHGMRECLVWYVNQAPTQTKQEQKKVPTFGGTRVYTISYQSRKETITNAQKYYDWLIKRFPEQTEQITLFRQDINTLYDLRNAENRSVEQAMKKL